jgi:hypothetical protein
MKHSAKIGGGIVRISFESKPPATIRDALKRNKFRWYGACQEWQARVWNGAADFLGWLEKAMNPGKPDGACWVCQSAEGFFRPEGAATPVRCNECQAEVNRAKKELERQESDYLNVDRQYEDDCARRCGL